MQIAVRKLSFRFLTVELSSRKFEAGMCFRYDTLFKDPLFFNNAISAVPVQKILLRFRSFKGSLFYSRILTEVVDNCRVFHVIMHAQNLCTTGGNFALSKDIFRNWLFCVEHFEQ